MKLIIGGAFQGKKEYAQEQFSLKPQDMRDGKDMGFEEIFSCTCVYHFHEWIRKGLKENWKLEGLEDRLWKENPEIILITNELGYGIVPIEAFDRKYRETTGRLCTGLAARSSQVIRVICGIGTVLKDD